MVTSPIPSEFIIFLTAFRINFIFENLYIHNLHTFDKHHNSSWFLQGSYHPFQRLGPNNFSSFCFICQKRINFICCSIESTNCKVVVIHIQNEILAHYSQSNQRYICSVNTNYKVISLCKYKLRGYFTIYTFYIH